MFQQYCARCGNSVGEHSRFCATCGSNLIHPGSVTDVPPASVSPPPANGSSLRRLGPAANPPAAAPSASPANPFAAYGANVNAAANPFSGAAANVANPGYSADANPYAPPDYVAALNQPAAPYLPGYDQNANTGANPVAGYGALANPGANPYGYGAMPDPYYIVPTLAPRRGLRLYVMIIAPIALLSILLIFYFVLSGFTRVQFGQVSSALGSGSIDAGCHFSASGNGLRGELSAAIATMCQTNSFHIVMDGKINGQSLSVSGNFRRGAGQFDANALGVTYHGIIIGNDAYLSYDGQKWVSDSSGEVHNVALFAALFDFIPSNFSDALTDKGYETMLGGERAHKILATGGGPGTIVGPSASGSVTFWVVNDKGTMVVRHLQTNLTQGTISGNMDMEYTNFNVPVNVTTPPVAGNSGSSSAEPGSGSASFKSVIPTINQ